jgi:hypothetical protein
VRSNPPRTTGDWEDDSWYSSQYWQQPLADYRYPQSYTRPDFDDLKGTQHMPEENSPRDQGFGFGQALSTIFTLKPAPSYSKLLVLARQFAKWAGFRSLDDGTEFMDGFIDGVFSTQPKLIEESKKE